MPPPAIPPDQLPDPLDLITTSQLAKLLDRSPRTVSRMIENGTLPRPFTVGGRTRYWRKRTLLASFVNRERASAG